MVKINALIIDDEPIARAGILEHISQIEFIHPVAECKDTVEAIEWLHRQPVDVLFLDIEMPGLSGLDFIKNLPDSPLVIFTTAYPEYAIESYELDVLDYLLKPISFPRFLRAAMKARNNLSEKRSASLRVDHDFFFIKCNQKIEKVMIADVLYVEGLSNYIIIHTQVKKYIVYLTFKSIEEQLPPSLFIRAHKSYLVSIKAIRAIDAHDIFLDNNTRIPISKGYREELMSKVNQRLFKR